MSWERAYLGPNPARLGAYTLKNQDFYEALRTLAKMGTKGIGRERNDYTFELSSSDTLFTLIPKLILRLMGRISTIKPDPEAHVKLYRDDEGQLCIDYWATEEGLKKVEKKLPPKD